MKKSICIEPFDDDMEVLLTAVSLLSSFKKLGFDSRKSFMEIVVENLPEYHEYDGMQKLFTFWSGRLKDKKLNEDLQVIIEKLKLS